MEYMNTFYLFSKISAFQYQQQTSEHFNEDDFSVNVY